MPAVKQHESQGGRSYRGFGSTEVDVAGFPDGNSTLMSPWPAPDCSLTWGQCHGDGGCGVLLALPLHLITSSPTSGPARGRISCSSFHR
jgi:hypothetical protein